MTTIVAVQKDGETLIGADSLSVLGNTGAIPGDVQIRHAKIIRHNNTYLGYSGPYVNSVALPIALKDCDYKFSFSSKEDIYKSIVRLDKYLEEYCFLYLRLPDKDPGQASNDRNMLIANEHGIFRVGPDRSIVEFKEYWAIGSGDEFAIGCISALYDHGSVRANELVCKALMTAERFDCWTAAPFEVHRVGEK